MFFFNSKKNFLVEKRGEKRKSSSIDLVAIVGKGTRKIFSLQGFQIKVGTSSKTERPTDCSKKYLSFFFTLYLPNFQDLV